MRCSDYEGLISAYADGELTGPNRAKLEEHLAHCDGCSRIYEETRALQSELSTLFVECEDAPDLVTAVTNRIAPRRGIAFRWAWVAAAVLVLVAVLVRAFLVAPHIERKVALTGPNPAGISKQHVPQGVPRKDVRQDAWVVRSDPPTPNRPLEAVSRGDQTSPNPSRIYPRPGKHIARTDRPESTQPASAERRPEVPPSPVSVEEGKITVQYVDADPDSPTQRPEIAQSDQVASPAVANRTRGTVVAVTETVTQNGMKVRRPSYRITGVGSAGVH